MNKRKVFSFALLVLMLPTFGLATAWLPKQKTEKLNLNPQVPGLGRQVERVSFVKGSWFAAEQKSDSVLVSSFAKRSHDVHLDSSGNLTGRLSTIMSELSSRTPAEGVEVFIAQGNVIVAKARTNDEGEFKVRGLSPSSYSFVARSEGAFLGFGMNLLSNNSENANDYSIDAALVPVGYNTLSISKPLIAPKMVINRDSEVKFAPTAVSGPKATSIRTHQVELTNDGKLIGRIHQIDQAGNPILAGDAAVILVQGDTEVARTTSDEMGIFHFSTVDPGAYSIVASNKQGFAAFGFEAIKAEIDSREVKVATAAPQIHPTVDFALAAPLQLPEATVIDPGFEPISFGGGGDGCFVPSVGCGGCGGCGCGDAGFVDGGIAGGGGGLLGGGLFGGGLFGGGGGLFGGGLLGGGGLGTVGRLALIGGISYGIAEAVSDDGANLNQQNGSPSNP